MTESYAEQLTERQPSRPLLNRPLPPLMPLSDPGPRLLPSTLALHRASHLLSYRNLESEPLPHPLPASLHPPAPVSVSDLDLDFILSGAYDPPPIDESKRNLSMGNTALSRYAMQNRPGVQLGPGATDEDSFAKFVGAFDEEYDSRRGDWTFRARSEGKTSSNVEWESPGAGRYTISGAREVMSQRTGKGWRVRKVGVREIELDRIPEEAGVFGSENSLSSDRAATSRRNHLVLASKRLHADLGGLKIVSRSASIATTVQPVRKRQPSQETRMPIQEVAPEVPSRGTRSQDEGSRPMSGAAQAIKGIQARIKEASGSGTKDKKKDRASFGDKLKRTWLATVKSGSTSSASDKAARREERERERGQSRSWSGESSQSNWSQNSSASRNRSATEAGANPSEVGSALGNVPEYSEPPTPTLLPGKAWESVPEDAMAMVIPLGQSSLQASSGGPTSADTGSSGRASFLNDTSSRVLLVYFVPFLSGVESNPSSSVPRPHPERQTSATQRLLKRQSKEKVPFSPARPGPSATESGVKGTASLQPLPFRSFRIVAKIVRPRDLKSQAKSGGLYGTEEENEGDEEERTASDSNETVQQVERVEANDEVADIAPFASPSAPRARGSDSTIIADKKRAGSEFPIIVAVCHSRAQGVEFVLEGLDRLGLCSGQSAWGPTGYEEWRGSGLSEEGREILDALWAASVGIMGL